MSFKKITMNKILKNKLLRICFKENRLIINSFHQSCKYNLFWEQDKKGGYDTKIKKSEIEHIKDGLKLLKSESKLFVHEVIEKLRSDPILINRPGETDVIWNFKSKDSIDKWVVSCDKDFNEGKSECQFYRNENEKGVFSGILNKELPKDGITKKAGYCNIRTKRKRKSFMREDRYDWNGFNTIVMKIRGDGRTYLLNLTCEGAFDVWWYDIYNYALFTRGGPYWQYVKIPFSKFFLSSKGHVQDRQDPIQLNRITHFGITAADSLDGPFRLEIDYIGVEYDPDVKETFAYETYEIKQNFIIQT